MVLHHTPTAEPDDPTKDVSADEWNEAHDINWGEAGDITTQAFGDSPAAGASGEIADAAHRHGMPSLDFGESGDITAVDVTTTAAGSTGEVADAGHVHGLKPAIRASALVTASQTFV